MHAIKVRVWLPRSISALLRGSASPSHLRIFYIAIQIRGRGTYQAYSVSITKHGISARLLLFKKWKNKTQGSVT